MVRYLEFAFSEKRLRDLCESQLTAERSLGIHGATSLRARLADFSEVDNVRELVAGPPQFLDDAPPGRVAVPLVDSFTLVFSANHPTIPLDDHGKVNWARVSRIKILEIGGLG